MRTWSSSVPVNRTGEKGLSDRFSIAGRRGPGRRTLSNCALLVLVCTGLPVLGVLALAAPAGAAPPPPGWNAITPSVVGQTAVSCVGGSVPACWSMGPVGGAGDQANVWSESGGTWTATSAALPTGSSWTVASLSCTSAAAQGDCAAVGTGGGAGYAEGSINGAAWANETITGAAPTALTGVSCAPGSTTCLAVGTGAGPAPLALVTSTITSWAPTTGALPATTASLSAISCPTTTTCFAIGTSTAAGHPPQVIETTNGGSAWSVTPGSPPAEVVSLSAISCPSATTCFATGAVGANPVIVVSSDGGTTWDPQFTPPVGTLSGITCTSSTSCIAVGPGPGGVDALIATSDGATWYSQGDSGASAGLAGVGCENATNCIAGGTAKVVATSTGGQTVPVAGPTGVSVSAGNGAATVSWVPPTTGGPFTSYSIIPTTACGSCSGLTVTGGSTDYSVVTGLTNGTSYAFTVFASNAAGPSPQSTRSGGVTPGPQPLGSPPAWNTEQHSESLAAVGCAPAGSFDCWAVGQQDPGTIGESGLVLSSTNGGAGWSRQAVPAPAAGSIEALSGVGCTSSTACFATGYSLNQGTGQESAVLLSTATGGSTWAAVTVPPDLAVLNGVSCPSATVCVAVGAQVNGTAAVIASSNGGTSWSQPAMPPGTAALNSVSCPSPAMCVAVGGAPAGATAATVVASTDGGYLWSLPTAPTEPLGAPAAPGLTSVSCTSATDCYAVGPSYSGTAPVTDAVVTVDGGATWTAEPVAGVDDTLEGVSCLIVSGNDSCWAAGSGAGGGPVLFATADGGSTWSGETSPAGVSGFDGVWCSTSTACAAIGSATGGGAAAATTANGGALWSPANAGIAPTVTAISCSDANDCETAGSGWGVSVTTNGGTSWVPELLAGATSLDAMACPTPSDCFAGGLSGGNGVILATTDGGTAWAAQSVPAGVTSVTGLGCASASVCFATGTSGAGPAALLGTTNSGGSWAEELPLGSAITTLSGVSCFSATACVAVGTASVAAGDLYTTNGGTTWTAGTPSGNSLSAVSCDPAGNCLAVGAGALGPVAEFSADGGKTWGTTTIPPPFNVAGVTLSSASCSPNGACVVGGSVPGQGSYPAQGFVLTSAIDTKAALWTPSTVSGGAGDVTGISCPSGGACFAAFGGIASAATTGLALPGPPVIGTATVSGASATVTWAVPANTGGGAITGYSVTPSPACPSCGGLAVAGTSTTTTVTGLAAPQAYTFTVTATNAAGTGPASSASNSVTTSAVTVTTPSSLAGGTEGVAYSQTLSASGGTAPYTWALSTGSTLPAGLTLSSNGVIAGSPTAVGNFTFSVTVSDSQTPTADTAFAAFTIAIASTTLAVTTASLPLGLATVAYSASLTASGGLAPYTWAVATGSTLPAGLSLTASGTGAGTISGTPTAAAVGKTSLTFTVTDSASPAQLATVTLSLTVNADSLTISPTFLPDAQVGVAYSQQLTVTGGEPPYNWGLVADTLPSGLTISPEGLIAGTPSIPLTADFTIGVYDSEPVTKTTPLVAAQTYGVIVIPAPTTQGYWEVGSDGGVFSFGANPYKGSPGQLNPSQPPGGPNAVSLAAPVVGAAPTPDGLGYWEVGSDGGVLTFGDAGYFGSPGQLDPSQPPGGSNAITLAAPVVGIAPTPDGFGYYEVAQDGGIFSFGDALFLGSRGAYPYEPSMVAMAVSPDGLGYWEIAADGAVFTYGDAGFFGSMGGKPLAAPMVGFAATPNGQGYWEVGADGGVFGFGDAAYLGGLSGTPLSAPVTGVAGTLTGKGYWLTTAAGGIYAYGDATYQGSMGGLALAAPVVAVVAP